MHELSIAKGIIEIVEQNVPSDDLPCVRSVSVRVGAVSGVVPESLAFGYRALVDGTPLANSVLHVERVPFRFQCRQCSAITENESGVAVCEKCWSTETTVLSGIELDVVQIKLKSVIEKTTERSQSSRESNSHNTSSRRS